jgi:protein-S-isoprenylcysteine O-methyltransferase Ste14
MNPLSGFLHSVTAQTASSGPDPIGVICIVFGAFIMMRYHYFPEKFSARVRPRTVYIVGTLLVVIGVLLTFWNLLWRLVFHSDVTRQI